MPTSTQADNVAVVEKWARYFNDGDVEGMIRECYRPGAEMRVMGVGAVNDADDFLAFERAVIEAAPNRRITLVALYPSDNRVIVEALLFNPKMGAAWSLPWCTILTFLDGKIASDRNYLDFSKWPAADTIQPES